MGAVRELPRSEAPAVALPATAEQWMHRALALEEKDPPAAIDAYRRSLRIRPECTEGWINLGRLHAETGDAANAHECFRTALERDPDERPYYNLSVLAQDARLCGGGTLEGRIIENRVVKFHWIEPHGAGEGEGVWRLKAGKLEGSWGRGQSETDGGTWNLWRSQQVAN
jgi:tetratricopeptide (TPR) repeat protein